MQGMMDDMPSHNDAPTLMDMRSQFLAVAEEEGEEAIELPCEDDGCLLLSTLQAQFPGASGLKYRNPETNAFRGIRLTEGRLYPPDATQIYICVFPKDNKRKGDEGLDNPSAKTKKLEKRKCTDLIVMGLPWRATDSEMRRHFEEYGPLVLCSVKRDPKSGDSRGFGFIRFQDYDAQVMCLANRHFIEGRWCDVKIPNSRQQEGQDHMQYNSKVFVGQLPEDITQEELLKYFSQHGTVTDVFIPRPFRSFAFVTFSQQDAAHAVLSKEHTIKNRTVTVGTAVPKIPHHVHQQQQQQQQQMQQQQFNPFYQAMAAAGGPNNQGGPKYSGGGPGAGPAGQADPNAAAAAALNMFNPAVLAALGNIFSGGAQAAGPGPGPRGDIKTQQQYGGYGGYGAHPGHHDGHPNGGGY